MNYIFIDGSYYIFYRYYSLISWFKNQRENADVPFPHTDPEMIDRFSRLFIKGIQEIPKKLGISNTNYKIYAAKDCPREDIWRTQLFPEYKAGRKAVPEIGAYFDKAYSNLFMQTECQSILSMNHLEADDCIALAVKQVLQQEDDFGKIYIFTSDKDYLQLCSERVIVMNMQYKKLNEQTSSHQNASMDLFCKILCGDPSDNISPVFKKCGPKTAAHFYSNLDVLSERFSKEEGSREKFLLNETLIDFRKIPEALQSEWLTIHKKNIRQELL